MFLDVGADFIGDSAFTFAPAGHFWKGRRVKACKKISRMRIVLVEIGIKLAMKRSIGRHLFTFISPVEHGGG